MSRYDNRRLVINNNEQYDELFEKRKIKRIEHYVSPALRHPSALERSQLMLIPHVWTTGDRLYKLAYDHYGDESLWWIIAWFNGRPTEAHVHLGDLIQIPKPLNRVYDMLGY